MAIALALASAVVYGVSDYVGGRSSRRVSPLTITFIAELTLLVIFVPTVPLLEGAESTMAAFGWGVVGGLAGAAGVLGLYAALSRGNMTTVAPITGVVAAVVPVVVGVGLGERPGPVAAGGIGLALVAVALIGGVAGAVHQVVELRTVGLAVVVGGLFAVLFIAYSRAGDDTGLWPLMWARVGGTPLLAAAALVARRRGSLDAFTPMALRAGMTIGVLVGIANGLYLLSTREGLLSIVAVMVSLYPASTIVLATVLDRERAGRSQVVGMLVAVAAVTAITLGS